MINEIFMGITGIYLFVWTGMINIFMKTNQYDFVNLYFVGIIFIWTGIIKYKEINTPLGEQLNKTEVKQWQS